ncbi:unnamed protein product [Oncorhynchus mykiss]|uniref:ASD2 domain-containing protein n=1 Tax=Oncorhynchus mykiss TaxID=8022 RepID=A0A060XWV1_ONCMY|nr:unnamed protein product [Oncorhynchus mykiss]
MVDIASQTTMPSESETDKHVARNFLTKILRSSMRRNEPVSRPHSWHSSKFTEDHPEPTESHNEPPPAPPPVWQVKHEVSASTKDLSSCGDHDSNLRQLSSQFSSVGNMERVDRPSHPFQPGCLSPSRYHRSAEPLSGGGGSGGKRESAFSCLSSTSPPPEPALANTDTAATESSMFHKGVQTQTSEDGRPGEQRHSRYLQRPQGDGGSESPRTVPEEQPGSRYSSSGSGRSHIGPVWHVPERRRVAAPPSPPLRSDSFAVTKVYPAYTEGPGAPPHGQMKAQDRLAEAPENSSYRGRGNHISHDENGVDPSNPNKLSSVSSQDVRQSQSPFTCLPNHQRQYSDESTFYLQTRSAPHPPKPQSVGSYYHSLQELPTNCTNSRNHVRSSTTSLSTSTIDQNYDCGGHIRYYCITTKQPAQPETHVRQSKSEVKYPPNPQPAYTNSKERNGNFQPANVLLYGHTTSNSLSSSAKPTTEENERKSEGQRPTEAQLRSSYSPSPPKDHKVGPLREDPWVSQENHKISSQKTPMLHSLAQEKANHALQEALTDNTATGKLARRSDRYATTLRNEIQLKRAQLQKSRSAATLTCPSETEEPEEEETDPGGWKSTSSTSSDGSFSTTTSGTLERGEGKARGRAHSGETEEGWRPGLANETSSDHHPDPLSPAGRQALLEQQRLGTFAEYQVTWNMQRKASDTKPQGRYHSADNILDQGTEETPVCVHERSRSSPSQDFHTQKIPMPWRETVENPYLDHRRDQQGGSYTARGQSESRGQPAQLHHFPQPPQPSIPRLTDTEPHSSRDVATPTPLPLPSEHRYKRDSANPAHNLPALPPYPSNHTHSSVSEQPLPPPTPAPKPQNTGLIIMPHWPLLGLETSTTSSSYGLSPQEFLPGPCTHQAEPSSSSSCSSHGTELDPAPNQACSLGSTQLPSPSPRRTTGLGTEEGAADSTLEPPPSPSSHSPFFSYQPASLTVPSSGGTSSPSPHFAPQRLTDQPPVSVSMQDEAQSRLKNVFITLFVSFLCDNIPHIFLTIHWPENRTNAVMEMSSVGKKVPVKIVHAESTTERESRQYLLHSEKNRAPGVSEGPDLPPPLPTSLPSPEPQPYSLFRAYTPYTRHGPQSPPRDPTLTVAPEEALSPGQSQTNGPSGTSTMGPQQPQKSNSDEDVKREELARDIMDKDKSLVDILDQSKMKTTMDLMEGIFPQGEQILDGGHQRRKVSPKQGLPPRGMDDRREEEGMSAATGSLVTSSSYYSTSAPKAELLNKMKDMQEDELEELEQDSEDELDINLASKKQELIDSLGKKLQVLREARESLQEDVHDNNSLGDEVEAVVQKVCKPNELDKFRMFVGDLDKVVSLLLSLSGRLARVENALNSLEEDTTPEEKRTLSEKRKLLIRQHEDAKELKENLDRRERLVYSIMAAHLSHESLADYQHFVKMKSALIIEQRKLEDKIKLGEEQLKCLLDSLLLEQRLLF